MTSLTNRSLSSDSRSPKVLSLESLSAADLATLPTMYDLPSEYPEEPGLPDEFHDLQPSLLSRTLQLRDYKAENLFTGTDLNVYYDPNHTGWHKRPDWFLAVNVPRAYDEKQEPRRSYVVWHEGQVPSIVIEFLSYSTEKQDLGRFYESADRISEEAVRNMPGGELKMITEQEWASRATPPDKFAVYEQYLKVPHYIVYSRHTGRLRYFQHNGRCYEERPVEKTQAPALWLDDFNIGLGVWDDYFEGLVGPWLRWCDAEGNWLLTDTEQAEAKAEQAEAKAEQAEAKANRLAEELRALGIDPDQI